MGQYTKEEKAKYFNQLRSEWREAKAAAEGNTDVQKVFEHLAKMGVSNLSTTNIQLIVMQAEEVGLDGMPYIDFKTYKGWKESGFQVRKGEKSKVHTITWINTSKEDEPNDNGFLLPRLTHLFHSSQVDEVQ